MSLTLVWSIGKCGPTNRIHPIACQKCDPTDCVCPSHLCTTNNKISAWQIDESNGTSLCIDQAVHRTQRAPEFHFKHDNQSAQKYHEMLLINRQPIVSIAMSYDTSLICSSHLPDVIHVVSVARCSPFLPLFCSMYYCEHKPKKDGRPRLLSHSCVVT